MDKSYTILVYTENGALIGAYTDLDAFDKSELKERWSNKYYDLVYGWWHKEWIMYDHNLDDFNLIQHN